MCVCLCVYIYIYIYLYIYIYKHTHTHMYSLNDLLSFLNINTPAFILLVYHPIECQISPIGSLFDEILPCCEQE